MLPIYICEDNKFELNIISDIVKEYVDFNFDSDQPDIYEFSNPNEMLRFFKKQVRTGIYLLDYRLDKNMNGVQLASEIRKEDPLGFIIFITTYSECAALQFKYQVGALTYIRKNADNFKQNICKAINCAYSRYDMYINANPNTDRILKIMSGGKYYKFYIDDITHICSSNDKQHYVNIHTKHDNYLLHCSLSYIAEQLPDNTLFKCGRSMLINLNYVDAFDKKKRIVYLGKNNKLEIPRRIVPDFVKKISEGISY